MNIRFSLSEAVLHSNSHILEKKTLKNGREYGPRVLTNLVVFAPKTAEDFFGVAECAKVCPTFLY